MVRLVISCVWMDLRPCTRSLGRCLSLLLLACFQTEELIYLYQSKRIVSMQERNAFTPDNLLRKRRLHSTVIQFVWNSVLRMVSRITASYSLSIALLVCVEGNFIERKVLEFNFTQQTEYIEFPFILLSTLSLTDSSLSASLSFFLVSSGVTLY